MSWGTWGLFISWISTKPSRPSICHMLIRLEDAKKVLKSYSKILSEFNYFRVLEQQCNNFKVKLSKPKNVKAFMDALSIIVKERQKAENVLLDEVETDIENKEKFISEQVKTL
jgi:hypothetical protein